MSGESIILSVSRRTDVPAFYSEWFMNRVREGRVEYLHPYGGRRVEVSLDPESVAAVVFWTKDFLPMLERLDELEERGFGRYLVHFTITGLGRGWEPRAPSKEKSVDTLRRLGDRIGPERVLWRFDPMVFTEGITIERTISRFAGLCRSLEGYSRNCFTSVFQPYRKTAGRVRAYEEEHSDRVFFPSADELGDLALSLSSIARGSRITVRSCCTPGLVGFGVLPSRCVDAGLIRSLWPGLEFSAEEAPTRRECGCHRSIDIGAYDTCPHRCLYCYANCGDKIIEKRHAAHRPERASLSD